MQTTSIETIKAFIAAWEARDLDRIMSYLAADCLYHNIPLEPLRGTKAIRESLAPFIAMSTEIEWLIHHIGASETDAVLTERTDRFKIGDRWLAVPVMGVFELAGDKITGWRDYFDLAQFQAQMAALA